MERHKSYAMLLVEFLITLLFQRLFYKILRHRSDKKDEKQEPYIARSDGMKSGKENSFCGHNNEELNTSPIPKHSSENEMLGILIGKTEDETVLKRSYCSETEDTEADICELEPSELLEYRIPTGNTVLLALPDDSTNCHIPERVLKDNDAESNVEDIDKKAVIDPLTDRAFHRENRTTISDVTNHNEELDLYSNHRQHSENEGQGITEGKIDSLEKDTDKLDYPVQETRGQDLSERPESFVCQSITTGNDGEGHIPDDEKRNIDSCKLRVDETYNDSSCTHTEEETFLKRPYFSEPDDTETEVDELESSELLEYRVPTGNTGLSALPNEPNYYRVSERVVRDNVNEQKTEGRDSKDRFKMNDEICIYSRVSIFHEENSLIREAQVHVDPIYDDLSQNIDANQAEKTSVENLTCNLKSVRYKEVIVPDLEYQYTDSKQEMSLESEVNRKLNGLESNLPYESYGSESCTSPVTDTDCYQVSLENICSEEDFCPVNTVKEIHTDVMSNTDDHDFVDIKQSKQIDEEEYKSINEKASTCINTNTSLSSVNNVAKMMTKVHNLSRLENVLPAYYCTVCPGTRDDQPENNVRFPTDFINNTEDHITGPEEPSNPLNAGTFRHSVNTENQNDAVSSLYNDANATSSSTSSNSSGSSENLYRHERARYRTFWCFPLLYPVSPTLLAGHGFYYEGHQDEAICFCCKVRHSNWRSGEDISAVHARISPNCPVVTGQPNGNVPIHGASSMQTTGRATGRTNRPNAIFAVPQTDCDHNPQSSLTTNHFHNGGNDSSPTFYGAENHIGQRRDFRSNTPTQRSSDQQISGATGNVVNQHVQPSKMLNEASTDASRYGNVSTKASTTLHASSPTMMNGAGATTTTNHVPSTGQQQRNYERPFIHNNPTTPNQNIGQQQQIPAIRRHTELQRQQRQQTSTGACRNITGRPCFPKLENVTDRASSFHKAPLHPNQTPMQLAEAGFFYAEFRDHVRCFFCGGGYENWKQGEDPWVVHARTFPKCQFLKSKKGQHFINLILNRQRESSSSTGNQNTASDEIPISDIDAPLPRNVAAPDQSHTGHQNALSIRYVQEILPTLTDEDINEEHEPARLDLPQHISRPPCLGASRDQEVSRLDEIHKYGNAPNDVYGTSVRVSISRQPDSGQWPQNQTATDRDFIRHTGQEVESATMSGAPSNDNSESTANRSVWGSTTAESESAGNIHDESTVHRTIVIPPHTTSAEQLPVIGNTVVYPHLFNPMSSAIYLGNTRIELAICERCLIRAACIMIPEYRYTVCRRCYGFLRGLG